MNAVDNLIAALEAAKPELAADYAAYFTRQITRFMETDGVEYSEHRKLINRGGYHADHYRNIRHFMNYATETPTGWPTKLLGVKTAYLNKMAAEYADQVVAAHAVKLRKKLNDLQDVTVVHVSGAEFAIEGRLGDRNVRVEQTQIGKVSSRGTYFHQWPARIYVNGKFTPEVEFKKLEVA